MTSILYVRKTVKKARKKARSASPKMSATRAAGLKSDLRAYANLEKIAEDPRKSIKTRQAALSKIAGIQRRWDAGMAKAGR
jgi:hypothetical protein